MEYSMKMDVYPFRRVILLVPALAFPGDYLDPFSRPWRVALQMLASMLP
jgi:hypothetical protein